MKVTPNLAASLHDITLRIEQHDMVAVAATPNEREQ